jgi:cell wall-associated NlpC family hydrolase
MAILVSQTTLSVGEVVDNILGKPFEFGGRGPGTFDCLGVVLHVLRGAFGLSLPDPGLSIAAIETFKKHFRHVNIDDKQPGDVVHVVAENDIGHQGVAVVESKKWLATASIQFGVHRTELHRFRANYPEVICYRPVGYD